MLLFTGRFMLYGLLVSVLAACGGGGGGGGSNTVDPITSKSEMSVSSASSASRFSSVSSASSVQSSAVSSDSQQIILSGVVTYDYVPHRVSKIGLDYAAISKRPVRGAVVELVDDAEFVVSSGITGEDGSYRLKALPNQRIKVRVRAQLTHNISPTWNFKVTDNTNNNSLYVMEGRLSDVGTTNVVRNLHADAGWDGTSYSSPRVAAPFAILDDVYEALKRVNNAGNTRNYPSLNLRWSPKNSAADGDISLGEIGSTYFSPDDGAIYVLGDENNDTDEFDPHVLLHEWGHYFEDSFSRDDSIGGDHGGGDSLDIRVSMSEGFANALSGILLNDPRYTDAGGINQASGFSFDISNKSSSVKGSYSENSIQSVFYNYYLASDNNKTDDLAIILNTLMSANFYNNDAMASIYLFYQALKNLLGTSAPVFSGLLVEQNIFGEDEFGSGEKNNAKFALTLPMYKVLNPNSGVTNVCSLADYGKFNKLDNSQLLKLTVNQAASYKITALKSIGVDLVSKPEFVLYNKGIPVLYGKNTVDNEVSGSINLRSGTYILEVYDTSNHDPENTDQNVFCFDVSASVN